MGVDWAAQPWPLGVLAQSPGPTTICPCRAWFPSLADEVAAWPPSILHSDVGGEIRGGVGRASQGARAGGLSPLPYHRARDCRAGRGGSPQHRERRRSWVGGSSSCGSSGTGLLHSSGHTRTRGSSVTSLRALNGSEKGRTGVWLRQGPPRVPRAWGEVPCWRWKGLGRGGALMLRKGRPARRSPPTAPGQARRLQKRRSW